MPLFGKTIASASVNEVNYRLKKPYVLSFGTIESLTSIQVTLVDLHGDKRIAETVPLVGYSDESADSIKEFLKKTLPLISGKTLEEARELVKKNIPECPFACSPLLTSIDLFSYLTEVSKISKIDFVVPASSEDLPELKNILEKSEKNGGGTVKIKLSGDIETDTKCIKFLSKLTISHVFIRFDANKAFSPESANSFYSELATARFLKNVHYVEQPLPVNDWLGHKDLIDSFPTVKTMLDESIVTREDLEKAIAIKVPFVKFKLFKQGGIRELIELSEIANQNNLKVVLGNGVATRLSNDIENFIFSTNPGMFFGASEANGFMKIYN